MLACRKDNHVRNTKWEVVIICVKLGRMGGRKGREMDEAARILNSGCEWGEAVRPQGHHESGIKYKMFTRLPCQIKRLQQDEANSWTGYDTNNLGLGIFFKRESC